MKNKHIKRINQFLDIPQEVISNEPKITIVDFAKVWIENYKNILEYQDILIKVNTYKGVVNINGFNLKLIHMTEDDLMIVGKIDSIDFEEDEEEGDTKK